MADRNTTIRASQLRNFTVSAEDIKVNSITGDKFIDVTISGGKIADGAVSESKLDIYNTAVDGHYLKYTTVSGMGWTIPIDTFLELPDTPTTYSGIDGNCLKATSSGIEFSDDVYIKPGQLCVSDGMNSAPSYSFSSSRDTGMYISSTDLIFTADGSDILKLDESSDTNRNSLYLYSPNNTKNLQLYCDQLWNVSALHTNAATLEMWAGGWPQIKITTTVVDMMDNDILTTGIATVGDGSCLFSSAAPTTDVMITNKKYVDDEVTILSGGLQTNIDAKPDTLLELTDTPSTYDNSKYLQSTSSGTEWATISGSGSSDHGTLTGLNDDDHTQYVLHTYAVGTGNFVAGVGTTALQSGGDYNILIGPDAGDHITTGSNNIYMGRYAGATSDTAENNIFLGIQSGQDVEGGAHNISIGYRSGHDNVSSNGLIFIGARSGESLSGAAESVGVGYAALRYPSSGQRNTALGYSAGEGTSGQTFSESTCIGYNTGVAKTTGGMDVLVGSRAGQSLTSATANVSIGYSTLYYNRTGDYNIAIGAYALYGGSAATDPHDNIAIGNHALRYANSSTQNNIALGCYALHNQTGSSYQNVAVGTNAGAAATDHYTQKSIFIGQSAGENVEIGANNNVIIGDHSGYSVTSGTGNILIGYQAGYNVTSDSNRLYIENSNSSSPLIYGEFDNDLVKINGTLELPNGTSINEFSTDTTLVGNSDDAVPTERAVKTYVDANTTGSGCWDRTGTIISPATTGDTLEIPDLITAGIEWTTRSGAVDNNWTSVAYGNGLFAAVAYSGNDDRAMTSPDGVHWTTRSGTGNNNWMAITYGNGVFVAVAITGTDDRVMTSPDGITWTSRTSTANDSWRSVAYGNGIFVAVSSAGTVMTSPDGITWTSRTAAAANCWMAVTYGDGLFVAVAYSGVGNRVMTSPDGKDWTIRTSASDASWIGVTYGHGLFVAVAYAGTGNRVMTSPDGITWTLRSSADDNNDWRSVVYGNGIFAAVGRVGDDRVMTSPDGITWTSRAHAATNDWHDITYGNGIFVAVSYTGTNNRVMTSGKTEITKVQETGNAFKIKGRNISETDVPTDGQVITWNASNSEWEYTTTSGGGSSDHGALTGLADDDHTQYTLVNGTRAFSSTITGVAPTADLHLATKKYVDDSVLQTASNIDVDTGTETVDTFADTAGDGCVWHFVVKNGTNLRTGQIMSCWDSSNNVEYTESSTNSLGNTAGLTLVVDISSNNVRLRATASSDNWSVKTIRMLM